MRVHPFAVVLVLLAAAVLAAGCVTPPQARASGGPAPASAPLDWPERALPWGGTHDHRKATDHVDLSTPNFEILAYDPLATDFYSGKTAGGHYCGGSGTTPGGQRLAVIGSFTTGVAFVVVDVTDAESPVKVGEYVLSKAFDYDVDMTADGRHVVIAAEPSLGERPPASAQASLLPALAPTVKVQPLFRDACTGETRPVGPERDLPLWPGVILVGLADPAAPTFEDFQPTPVLGPHSVSAHTVQGATYVTASITNLAHHASYFAFYKVLETPLGGRLLFLSVVDSATYGRTALINGHVDAELALHPVTGKMVAYLSNWDGGLILLDMSNPFVPLRLSQWSDTGVDGGQVHSTRSVEGLWDGRHYVLVGQEFIGHPNGRPSGWVYVLDDTDPARPFEVGRWTLPVDVDPDWQGVELYSTHYFRLVGRTLFVAMYHGGVWAVDLSNATRLAEPASVGVFVPDRASPNGPRPIGTYDYAPFVLDVFPYEDGTLAVFDGLSGLYTLRYDATSPAPVPAPWPTP